MSAQTLNQLTIKQARDGLAKKEFSAQELFLACLKEIENKDGGVHAFLETFEYPTSHYVPSTNHSSLVGIPIAIKDNILINGRKVSAASRVLENYTASYDATVVKKLIDAGALFLGRTNMDEFAMGSSTENSAYGPSRNPHDVSRVPGGSSGGSAAAVAANFCIAALGSDTGGSIRQPAALCGVVGFKPSYGAVSRNGLIAMASSLDVIGPITKTVEDAKILFDAIRGRDPLDSTTIDFKIQDSRFRIQGLRIGLPKEYFGAGLDPTIKKLVLAAVKKFEELGAQIKEISLPFSEYALAAYYIIMPAEVSANLARFDGIRYGASAANNPQFATNNLYDVYAKTRAHGFGAEVKRRVMLGTYILSAGYYDAYYLKAQKVRRLIREDFQKAFEDVDLIVGPTTPTTAFHFGEKTNDPLTMYLEDIYTVAANLAGIPALSIPCGSVKTDSGIAMPAGLHIMGRFEEDDIVLGAGMALEQTLR
ncbi:Asp-tRNA(Asn)/Glu-tRNA(Gln) amidotransferase subunit GatA [Patescibacteria group bacterium]|nr:Asp-tRNA(Asn)/Glu-tRNA(Gln) amidotransferase subunit GatA [Patescibacteria group bacterium]